MQPQLSSLPSLTQTVIRQITNSEHWLSLKNALNRPLTPTPPESPRASEKEQEVHKEVQPSEKEKSLIVSENEGSRDALEEEQNEFTQEIPLKQSIENRVFSSNHDRPIHAQEISVSQQKPSNSIKAHLPTDQQSQIPPEQYHPITRTEASQEAANMFPTEFSDVKSRIAKIKEVKESKKRKLEAELRRVNNELAELSQRQRDQSRGKSSSNHYESRVKVSDDAQALARAQKLVKGLRKDKKDRQLGAREEIGALDKNINGYMEQLLQERQRNQQMLKQRKKFEIIERMKQQEMRKMQEQQRQSKNLQFLHQLKQPNNKQSINRPKDGKIKPSPSQLEQQASLPPPAPAARQRLASKNSEGLSEVTPQLSRKKAYLKRVRNMSFKKQKVDKYEQVLF